ncbi:Hypothetical predicted protein [Mytilus galloprovincialis]|uniref:Uncharacterized protein n=1 Tax=Mytilus galloprovincialis TaxID=29158 RepID=A0A8B6C2I2_MYTGA|nr:Hypothetical predicted protein [Mytilus galloprovincialis]
MLAIGKAKPVKNYKDFWDKELDYLLKQRRNANRLNRTHNKYHAHDDEIGKRLKEIYFNRKSQVQEAIKRKERSAKIRQFNDKCINAKNKMKGFWNFLKIKRTDTGPIELNDPHDSDKILTDTDEINNALSKHFSSIGSFQNENDELEKDVKNLITNIDENILISDSPLSVTFDENKISQTLKSLKSGKACGTDGIPNEFLKYGGDILLNSLVHIFTKITDLEIIPDEWHKGIIIPIHKDGSTHSLSNYRGKKKDSDKKWYLGNDLIEEVNEYKYLGVYFSRSLKSTYHIEQYLKENFQRKINHAIRILGEHGDFNRINFGHSLWMSAIRPSLTYGCVQYGSRHPRKLKNY